MVKYNLAKTPIVDIVNQIILYAAQNKASDIHLDPREDALMIRMRIDGDLHNHSLIPKAYERNLITRVKLVSNMNITENRLPQDGAIKARIGGKDLDMRVSVLPTNEGEKAVIRILDFHKGLQGIDALAFSPKNYEKVIKMMQVPNGIILVTGATGSGKSTTTYSMLRALNKEETNIITVEDPIEMNIEGINQVQVNSEIGLTFAAALRSLLRHDPNIILIGEIRDSETAQIAVRASITGHLVLSTIHTNDSLSTIERLLDMNVERYLLSSAVTGIISQKLTRTLCNHCKRLRAVTKYEKYLFKKVLAKNIKFVYEPVGCDKCHGGFSGRMAIQEVLYISDKLRDIIADELVDKEELRKIVYDGTTTTMLQDALEKVVDGHTTFQEIYRVVDIDADLDNSIREAIGMAAADEEEVKEEDIIDIYDGEAGEFEFGDSLFKYEDYDEEIDDEDDELEDGLDIFDNLFDKKELEFKPEEFIFKDDDSIVPDEDTAISNVAAGAGKIPSSQTLDLDEVKFDYKEVQANEEEEVKTKGEEIYYTNDQDALFQITTPPLAKETKLSETKKKVSRKKTKEEFKVNKGLRHRLRKSSTRPFENYDIIDAFAEDLEIIDALKEDLEVIDAYKDKKKKPKPKAKAKTKTKEKLDIIDKNEKED